MAVKSQVAAIGFAMAAILVGGVFADIPQYALLGAAIILAFIGMVVLSRHLSSEISRLGRGLSRLDVVLSEIPVRLTQLTAAEIHSMTAIFHRFPECTFSTTSWSMRFTNLHTVLNCLDSRQPRQIVECGSGISTLMVASWLREQGDGHLLSLDHDSDWAGLTRRALELEGLGERAEVVVAPLTRVMAHGRDVEWYDLEKSSVTLRNVECVIVDGPPAGLSGIALNRLAVLEQLEPWLADDCTILLDDAFRPGEREILSMWKERWPALSIVIRGETTGMAVVRLGRKDRTSGVNDAECQKTPVPVVYGAMRLEETVRA